MERSVASSSGGEQRLAGGDRDGGGRAGEPAAPMGSRPARSAAITPEEEWNRAYDEAMRWRDWQTCEILIDEREQADWYVPDGDPTDVEAWGEVDH